MESIDLVDDDDRVIGVARRSEVRNRSLLYRISQVIILDENGQFLVQKRSPKKDIYPNLWDLGVAETLQSGENYNDAAVRGLKEELGLEISLDDMAQMLQFDFQYRSNNHNVNCKIYKCFYNQKFTIQADEIEQIEFMKKDEIFNLIEKSEFHPATALMFKRYLQTKENEF